MAAPAIRETNELELLQEVLLPSQFNFGKHRASFACGERRLMLALITDASFYLLTSHNRRQRSEIMEWLAGASSPVWFEQACSAVELDPEALRRGLKRLALKGVDVRLTDFYRRHRGR